MLLLASLFGLTNGLLTLSLLLLCLFLIVAIIATITSYSAYSVKGREIEESVRDCLNLKLLEWKCLLYSGAKLRGLNCAALYSKDSPEINSLLYIQI